MKSYYYCYNEKVMKHLKNNGIKYITQAIACSTNKIFWLFERDENLDLHLLKYQSKLCEDGNNVKVQQVSRL